MINKSNNVFKNTRSWAHCLCRFFWRLTLALISLKIAFFSSYKLKLYSGLKYENIDKNSEVYHFPLVVFSPFFSFMLAFPFYFSATDESGCREYLYALMSAGLKKAKLPRCSWDTRQKAVSVGRGEVGWRGMDTRMRQRAGVPGIGACVWEVSEASSRLPSDLIRIHRSSALSVFSLDKLCRVRPLHFWKFIASSAREVPVASVVRTLPPRLDIPFWLPLAKNTAFICCRK